MDIELTKDLVLTGVGSFLLGVLLASVASRFGSPQGNGERDPRDQRILSLEAELRVAQTEVESMREKLDAAESSVKEFNESIAKRDATIAHQQDSVDKMKKDLKESVQKTRELRAELSDRATQSVRSEAKLREVETELSVAKASTDLIATGVLDYSVAPDPDDP